MIVEPRVEEYAEKLTSPGLELFERLAAETREKTTLPQMMVGRVEGRFLEFLVRSTGAQLVLELGTFTGYSSISMALGLTGTGKIISCDVNAETTAIARRYAEEAGVADRIEYRLGPALDAIASLDGQIVERLQHEVGAAEHLVVGRIARVRDRDDTHTGGARRADAVARIFDRSTPLG